ncbi:MAG: hypothetical protein QG635_2449, partial [Bacteroidota bacterium]|nr:hypothetical protein [Bacteroidota bacterium]
KWQMLTEGKGNQGIMIKIYDILAILSLFILMNQNNTFCQHTFSIVAVDSLTGEIGSAGATCGDTIVWPGTPGARIISDIIPGTGAIHTQAQYMRENQMNARFQMEQGNSPQEIIDWLIENDYWGDPKIRQYGVVDFNNGSPRSAAYTGSDCMDYKNHITGKNYSIQGNILSGRQIIDSIESRFLSTEGNLAQKLMSALEGAKAVGADSRCLSNGTSSLSAFIRVAKPSDNTENLFLDINIGAVPQGIEPLTVLREKFDIWLSTGTFEQKEYSVSLYPNPCVDYFNVLIPEIYEEQNIRIFDIFGREIYLNCLNIGHFLRFDCSGLDRGSYFLRLNSNNITSSFKIIITD